jgi:putative ABC transport system permease protein
VSALVADRAAPPTAARRAWATAWLRERGMGASILVAAISSAFGVLLLTATGYIATWARTDPTWGRDRRDHPRHPQRPARRRRRVRRRDRDGEHVRDHRRRPHAPDRPDAADRRVRAGAAPPGRPSGRGSRPHRATAGLVVGAAVAAALVRAADALLHVTVGYAVLQPVLLLPAAVVALTTWAGAWSGSRRCWR